jgi:hypothetical protein
MIAYVGFMQSSCRSRARLRLAEHQQILPTKPTKVDIPARLGSLTDGIARNMVRVRFNYHFEHGFLPSGQVLQPVFLEGQVARQRLLIGQCSDTLWNRGDGCRPAPQVAAFACADKTDSWFSSALAPAALTFPAQVAVHRVPLHGAKVPLCFLKKEANLTQQILVTRHERKAERH